METNDKIQLFKDKHIRTAWDSEREEWYFSIVDVIGVLTDSKDPPAYWRKLKQRLKAEGSETVTNCHGLKMTAADGKRRLTDAVESRTGVPVITAQNAVQLNQVVTNMIENAAGENRLDARNDDTEA